MRQVHSSLYSTFAGNDLNIHLKKNFIVFWDTNIFLIVIYNRGITYWHIKVRLFFFDCMYFIMIKTKLLGC